MLPIIKKYKKRLILLGAALLIYIVTIFCYGYKIPWFDKHPDWGYFPQHTNPNIVIEEVNLDSITLETVVLPLNSKHKLVFGHKKIDDDYDSLIVLNENLQLVYAEKIFHLNNWFYPEIANNRIVIKYDSSYSLNEEKKYLVKSIAYDFDKFKKIKLPIKYYCFKDTLYKENIVELGYFRYNSFPYRIPTNIRLIDSVVTGNKFVKGSWWDRFNFSSGNNSLGKYGPSTSSRFNQFTIGYYEVNIGNETSYFKLENKNSLLNWYQLNTLVQNTDTFYIVNNSSIYRLYSKQKLNGK